MAEESTTASMTSIASTDPIPNTTTISIPSISTSTNTITTSVLSSTATLTAASSVASTAVIIIPTTLEASSTATSLTTMSPSPITTRAASPTAMSGSGASDDIHPGVIAGAVTGGVILLVLLLLCGCIMFCCCRRRRRIIKSSAKVEAVRPNLVVLDSPNNLDTKEMEKLSSEGPLENNSAHSVGSPHPGGEAAAVLGNGKPTPPPATAVASQETAGEETTGEETAGEETAPPKGKPPELKEYEKLVHAIEGQQATLRVELSGEPQPTLTWSYDGKTIEPDYAFEIARDGALCIVTLELTHSGTYYFTASNPSGSAEGKVELKVHTEEEGYSSKRAAPNTKPIPVDRFGEHVAGLHANNNMGFYKQYQSLPTGEDGHSVEVFKMAINTPKNRFRNIAVYDDNRIVLEPLPDEQSSDADYVNAYAGDYINASYIDGYSKPKAYIACQGPLPQTVVDFWRAVWQERVGSIVMVTNVVEGTQVKCQQYWPQTGSVRCGPFIVTLAEQQMFADYIIRHLQVSFEGKTRKVFHFQFTSWPDHGVPEYAGPTLTYLRRIKAESKTAKGTTLFHCSAGVGRTGTLLSIDTALEQAATEGVVDIPSIVSRLREQRMKMVQTHDQYAFIHDAVLESLICGETQIPAQHLPKAITQLSTTNENSGRTGFDVQFGVLDQVSPKPGEVITLTAQRFPEKNRRMDYLPSEPWRVPLFMENPGYINASFANGYKQKQGYIIAQAPMHSTCRDFWKMISDRRCGVIIMLSDLQGNGKEVCTQYWPDAGEGEGTATYGEFTVMANSVKEGTLTQRTFSVIHQSQPHHQHKVTQFQLKAWSDDGLCTEPRALLELIEHVGAVQRKTGNNAIVVHGVDTVSRCGLFCALTNAIDCCKTEGIVDVLQAVKALRIQKPGCVVNIRQYRSIFELMQQFLNSFSIYSNFR